MASIRIDPLLAGGPEEAEYPIKNLDEIPAIVQKIREQDKYL
jgi:hypothetical protein